MWNIGSKAQEAAQKCSENQAITTHVLTFLLLIDYNLKSIKTGIMINDCC